MAKYNTRAREEELKLCVAEDWFAAYDCKRRIGNIDFCAELKATPLGIYGADGMLWAEAKTGANNDILNYQQQTCRSKERTPRKMKTKTAVLNGKPDAGNPHVRFDEGEVASYPPTIGRPEGVAMRGAKPRRGSLLYKCVILAAAVAALSFVGFGGPKVSVIGDSYSTYQSWGATYYPNLDVRDISQQWWSQVIAGIDGASLEVNASWSGARMSGLDTDGGATTFSSFLCRARLIGNPDVILICGAMNDDWNGVSTAVLERDVELMFNDLDRNHPLAKKFFVLNAENAGGRPGLKPATRQCILGLCSRHYYPVVDLNGVLTVGSADYQSDHPTAQGMTKIANAVLAKYADCEQNGYPVRPDAAATVDADGLFTADDTTYTCEMVGDEYVVTFTNITHAITFTPLVPIDISRILVVGGGGAGGFTIGGGGGGGEVRDLDFGELGLDADESATIVVGQGGYEPLTKAKDAGDTDNKCTWWYNHGEGGASSITLAGTTYTALGGGAGGSWRAEKGSDGANGGGGAGTKNESRKGGASVNGGHAGGDVYAVGDYRNRAPGGGGGAGGDGQTPTSETVAGDGGAGVTSNISGVNRVYGAGGGGGIGNNTTTPGAGGTNAGSGASANNAKGGSAVDGFGGGGGGGGYDGSFGYAGGNGGNGTVIIRFSESVVEQTPAPRVGFRGVTATDHTSATYSWRFTSKGDAPEGATLVACDVYGVCSNATMRPMTNRLATVESAAPAVYSAVFAHLAPGTDYDGAVFAVSRYELAGGETAEYVSEIKTFSFSTVAETSFGQQFTEFEYLESTGTQYIKTGITPSSDLRIGGKYEVLPAVTLTGGKWVTIFGYYSSWTDGLCLWHDSGSPYLMFNRPSMLKTESIVEGRIYEFETSGASMTVNGEEYASSAAYNCSQTPDLPLFAFYAPAQGGYTTSGSHVRLYSFKIWKGDVLVRDFVPARDASGAVGMYDLVSERLFKNDGDGVFNAGDVVEAGRLAKTFALGETTFYGSTLIAALTQSGGKSGDVKLCLGSEYGADDLAAWQRVQTVGTFSAGANTLNVAVPDLPEGTVYVRFYSEAEDAWSPTIYLPGVEIASTPAPIVFAPVVKSLTAGSAQLSTRVAFLGTGATSCDVFSVCTLDGVVVVTNEVARNVTDSAELVFTLSPLRPGHDYAVRCFADNGAELGVGSSEEVGFTTPQENLGNLEYTEVEYLESSGTQYVKTGIHPSADLRIAGRYQHLAQDALTGSRFVTVFGYFNSMVDGLCLWTNEADGWKLTFNRPGLLRTEVLQTGHDYEFETHGASMTVNGVEYPSSATYNCTQSPDLPLFAFYCNNGYMTCNSKVRLYGFKIWQGENDALVRDFVPVKKTSTGEAGLLDLVTKTFFGNDGSGDFLYGSAVSEPRITPSLAATDLRYDGSTLLLGLTRAGAAAGEVFACFGPQYGGDDTNDWEHCVLAGRFAAGETAAELLVNGVGPETAYVRFFSVADNGWSPSVFMADVEVAGRMPPMLTSPVPQEVSLSRLSFDVCLSFAGTGADGCDVFSVVTVGGSSVTNLLATGAQVGATLSFEVSPVRPEAVYGIQCFATNSLPGGFGASTCVDVAAPAFGESLSIPADAEEIEYLESSGTQYVLTGVTPSANLRIAGKYEVLPAVALTDGQWVTIFGYYSSATDGLCLWHGSGYQNLMFNRPSLLKTESIVEGRIYEFETSGASMTVNGTLYSSSAAYNCSQTPDLPLFAFYAPYYGGYTTCGSHVRLYSFKIWDGETLVRDFVPVRDPSGVACFYDQVEGAYHYNAGRGAFIEGPVRKGGLVVTAEPAELGEASPAYGVHHCAEAGLGVECAVTAPAPAGTRTTVCTGWELFRNAGDGLWESVGSGSGSSMALTNDLTQTHKLVWKFSVLDVADVEPPVLKRTLAGGADFEISVNGLGLSSSTATLRLVCGYPPDRLSVTNVVATDVRSFTKHRASVGNLQPGGVFLAKAVLENDAGEVVESAPVMFLTDTVAAAADLAAGYGRIAYLESDGRQRVDTGIEPGEDTAVDFAFETLAYKNDTTFFGAQQWNNYQYLFIEQNYGSSPYFRFYDSQKNVAPFVANAAYELSLSADGTLILSKEGVAVGTLESVSRSAPAGQHLNVFDVEAGGHGGSFRFKSMRITKDYSLVRDFVPALRASDGAAGLYDRVTSNFFPSVTNPFPQQFGRAIFSAEQTEEGVRLELSAGSVDAELFCALGDRGAGDDVAEWASVVPIGTAAAAATSVTVSAPAEWGTDARCARFFAVTGGGVTNWGPVAVWTDPATPDVRNVTADGRGGDVLVVRGTVASFGGADCRLRVLIGTAFDTLVAYDGMDGATLTQPGDFMLTVGDADMSAVKPGTDYLVIVDAVSGGAVVQTEAVHVTTAGAAELTAAAIAAQEGRVATFSGTLGDLGVNGKAVVRLYVGEGEEESGLTAVGEPLAVTEPGPFAVSCKFAEFEKTYSVQLRVVSTTANGVPLETRSALLAVDSPPDTATYVWKQDVAEGDWCDVANWTHQEAVDCAGSPQTASASARFAAGTKAKVRLDRALAIKSLDLDAANLDLVFTGGATNRLTTSSLVLGKLEDGEVRGSRIVFDDAAVTAKDDPLYLGNGSELTFRNGADFLAEQSFNTQLDLRDEPTVVVTNRVNVLSRSTFATQDAIGLSGGTVFTVDDASLTFRHVFFNEHVGGGWLRIAGRHPVVRGSGCFRTGGTAKENLVGGLVFSVPQRGYAEPPLQYSGTTPHQFGGIDEAGVAYEPFTVAIDPQSPAYSYGAAGLHSYPLIRSASAMAVDKITLLPPVRAHRTPGTFVYSPQDGEPRALDVTLETRPSLFFFVQ